MSRLVYLVAQVDPSDLTNPRATLGLWHREFLAVFGTLGAVILLVWFWAAFVRKPRRRHLHHRHQHGQPWGMNPDAVAEQRENDGDETEKSGFLRRRRRRRRRRRDHRPRNPTLAETGGLPPVRTDKPPGDVPS